MQFTKTENGKSQKNAAIMPHKNQRKPCNVDNKTHEAQKNDVKDIPEDNQQIKLQDIPENKQIKLQDIPEDKQIKLQIKPKNILEKKSSAKYLIYHLFSGVGFYNQLFSLETAIYLANITNRKLILIIQNPLCHCGHASWDYGYLLNYFNDDYLEFLPNGIEVYYRQAPTKIRNIIKSDVCSKIKFADRFSNLVMIDPEHNSKLFSNKIKLFCNNRKQQFIDFKNLQEEYIYIDKSNASRCFYNFFTTKENYLLMSKICNSLRYLNNNITKRYTNNTNFDVAIHFRLGDHHKGIDNINKHSIKHKDSLFNTLSNLPDLKKIVIMSDRKDGEILDLIKKKFENVTFTDELVKDISVEDIKNTSVIKFLIQKDICVKSKYFIGTTGSTVSNYIQYLRYLNNKDYNHYTRLTLYKSTSDYSWNSNNMHGLSISWAYFWPDNIYPCDMLTINNPVNVVKDIYLNIVKEINISPKKNKKIISFCLYGLQNERNQKRHFDKGVYVNYHYMKNHNYKDWIMRIYMPYNEPSDVINKIIAFGDIELVLVETNTCLRALRFLPHDDRNVDIWISRDLDSIINNREEKAVEDWIENHSSKNLMTMSDDRQHTWTVTGGMFGYKNDYVKNYFSFITAYSFKNKNKTNKFANDCTIAEQFFYKKDNYIQYYRAGKKLDNSTTFPDLSKIHCHMVGNISPINKYYQDLELEKIYPFLLNRNNKKNKLPIRRFIYEQWKGYFKDTEPVCEMIWEEDDFVMTVDPTKTSGPGTFKTTNGDGKKLLTIDTHINILWEDKYNKEAYMPNSETICVKHKEKWYNLNELILPTQKFVYKPWQSFFKNEPICEMIWEEDDFVMTVDPTKTSGPGTFKTSNGEGKNLLNIDTHINILWENKYDKEAYMSDKNTIRVKHGNNWYSFTKIN